MANKTSPTTANPNATQRDPAAERGERVETGKAIARGGGTQGFVPGAMEHPGADGPNATHQREKDSPSRAPESGTERDQTSGNQPAHPHQRPTTHSANDHKRGATPDDPSEAGEER